MRRIEDLARETFYAKDQEEIMNLDDLEAWQRGDGVVAAWDGATFTIPVRTTENGDERSKAKIPFAFPVMGK
jgi:hypothetical protein